MPDVDYIIKELGGYELFNICEKELGKSVTITEFQEWLDSKRVEYANDFPDDVTSEAVVQYKEKHRGHFLTYVEEKYGGM